jgi:hypothetical protein
MSWSSADEIAKLLALRDAHVLSDDEFEQEKRKVLSRMPIQPEVADVRVEGARGQLNEAGAVAYLAEELRRDLSQFEADFEAYKRPFAAATDQPITDPMELTDGTLKAIKGALSLVEKAFDPVVVTHALGQSGKPADEEAIRTIVSAIAASYSSMLYWALRARGTTVSPMALPLLEALYELPSLMIHSIREYSVELSRAASEIVEAHRQGRRLPPFDATLRLRIGDQAVKKFGDATALLGASSRLETKWRG